jgi:hypothetical protein
MTLPSRLRMTTCGVVCSAGTTFRVVFVTGTTCRVVCRARTTHGVVISTRTTHRVVSIRQRKRKRAKAVTRGMGRMRAKAVTRGMARISWRVRMRRRAGMRAKGTRARVSRAVTSNLSIHLRKTSIFNLFPQAYPDYRVRDRTGVG